MISPKDRAKELVKSFRAIMTGPGIEANDRNAYFAALLCIQEIFDADYPGYPSQSEYDKWSEYWQEVKKEITLISE